MTNSCQVVADSAHRSTVDFINTFFGFVVQSNIPQKSARPFLHPIVNFLRDEKIIFDFSSKLFIQRFISDIY